LYQGATFSRAEKSPEERASSPAPNEVRKKKRLIVDFWIIHTSYEWEDKNMQYLLLIYGDGSWTKRSEAERGALVSEYRAFGEQFAEQILGSNPLQPVSTARTVRVRDGKRVDTDGPFAETKEQLGGYYLVDVPDIDAALVMAAKIPAARTGCVEVRPIMKMS
jgi:hypothetical protein